MNRSLRLFVALSLILITLLSLFACVDEEIKAIFIVDGEEYEVCSAINAAEFRMPDEPKKNGYSFDGWYLDEDGVSAFSADALVSGGEIYVYAKWKKVHVHTESEIKIHKEPTCFDDGISYTECTECGETVSTGFIEKLSHVASSEWQIKTPSTCVTEGVRIRTCTLCDTVMEEVANPLASHTEGAEAVATPAKCESTGLAVVKCTVCEEILSERELPAAGHNEGEEATVTEPTCLEKGVAAVNCTVCGENIATRVVDALGHEERTLEGYEPTETRDGLTSGVDCTRCFAVLTPQERIPAEITDCEIVIGSLSLSGTTFAKTVGSAEETLSLVGDIKINEVASFTLSKNSDGSGVIDDLRLPLLRGDNTFYITVTSGEERVVYTVSIYRKHTVTVTFETKGNTVAPITLDEGDMLESLPVSTLLGYDFVGWDIDLSGAITESVTATAMFEARTDTPYTVTYYVEKDGGYVMDSTVSCKGVTDAVAEIPAFASPHYTVNTKLSDTGVTVKAGIVENISIYLDLVSYSVRFETGHFVGMDKVTVTALDPYYPPEPPEMIGYRFDKWLFNGKEWTGTDAITSDVYLIASWVRLATVTFDTSKIDGLAIDPVTVDIGAPLGVTAELPTSEDKMLAFFCDGSPWILGYDIVTGDMTLVAVWVDKYVTVTFETKGVTPPDPITVEYGSVIESVTTPVRGETYSFEGWYVKNSDIRWLPGETPVTGDLTLEARWSIMTPPDIW